jgi:uncharacterized membrane protein
MTTSTIDLLIAGYLSRLEAASAALPPDRRQELLEEIEDHIATARAAGAAADEAAVRGLLERLGPPEEIVAAALDDGPSAARAAAPRTRLELAAVLLLTVGSFLPFLGWLIGALLLWVSARWTTAEKLLGTLVVPFGPGGALVLAGRTSQTCFGATSVSETSQGPGGRVVETVVQEETCTGFALPTLLGVPLLVVTVVAPFVVAGILYRRARARAAAEALS